MNYNKHYNLKGKHALLSPSSYHWINYSDEKMIAVYNTARAAMRGSELHELAEKCINLEVKLPRNSSTLNAYVNDAIKFQMDTEVILYFSENCFGSADALCFRNNKLRIHDLKTGSTKAHMEQLLIYAALFCLEYRYSPNDISIELRIYQSDDVVCHEPEPEEIISIMDTIVHMDELIAEQQERGR